MPPNGLMNTLVLLEFQISWFGIGTIVFGIMAWGIFGEIPTLKTIISLLLALAIILIQITNI